MSINNNNNNVHIIQDNNKKLSFPELINNTLEGIESRTKILKIKDTKIKENIRSINLKEKKLSKITEEIYNRKQELKLLKDLLHFKEQNSLNVEDIISSYLSFIVSSNNLLDDKLDSLMQKEMNINKKQKFMNKLLGKEIYDENYDLNIDDKTDINKPLDISKFILKTKKKKVGDNGGDNLDNFFMNRINNNNLFSIKRNKLSSDGIKSNDINKKSNKMNKYINKDLTKYQKYNINTVNISKIISNNNSNNKSENIEYNNTFKNNMHSANDTSNILITDRSDSLNYNLKPNKKLKSARETLRKILNGMNKSNNIKSCKNKDEIKYFILHVLDSKFFLRKILYICYELAETYNINKQKSIETINDNEFINKLIEDYEDVSEKNDLRELNNIKKYENGLDEIKKITGEIKELENEIIQFSHKINVYE